MFPTIASERFNEAVPLKKKLISCESILFFTFFLANPFHKAISPFELNGAVGPLEIFPPKTQIFAPTNFLGSEQLPQSPKAL